MSDNTKLAVVPDSPEPQYVPVVTKDTVAEFLAADVTTKEAGERFTFAFGVKPLLRTKPYDRAPWETLDEIALPHDKRDKLFEFVRWSLKTGVGHALPQAPDANKVVRPALLKAAEGDYVKIALRAILTICNATESFQPAVIPVGSARDAKVNVVLREIKVQEPKKVGVPYKVYAEAVSNSITF